MVVGGQGDALPVGREAGAEELRVDALVRELEDPVSAAGILLDEATRTVAEIAARTRGQSGQAARASAAAEAQVPPDGV